jgi:hypothetical protein
MIHRWTETEDDLLRLEYRQTRRSCRELGIALGLPWGQVRSRIGVLGLSKRTGRISKRYWTVQEDEKLQELIHCHSIPTVARLLGRSSNSVKIRATRLKLCLRSRDGWYTKQEVCEILGVDHKRVQSYIDAGQLKASYHNGHKPGKEGLSMWHIEEADLRSFVKKYCHEFNGRNVDLAQIVYLFADLPAAPRKE